eukprot:202212-Rhodomonas_salina.1
MLIPVPSWRELLRHGDQAVPEQRDLVVERYDSLYRALVQSWPVLIRGKQFYLLAYNAIYTHPVAPYGPLPPLHSSLRDVTLSRPSDLRDVTMSRRSILRDVTL